MQLLILLIVLILRIWRDLVRYVGLFTGYQVENNFWKCFTTKETFLNNVTRKKITQLIKI